MPDQNRHVPEPESPLTTVTPDLISWLWLASWGHGVFWFWFLCILPFSLPVAIAEKSYFAFRVILYRGHSETGQCSTLAYSVKGIGGGDTLDGMRSSWYSEVANYHPMTNPNPSVAENAELAIPKEKLVLLPFYHELENEVRQPDRIRLQTDYFWRKWAPKLGPTLTVLVITLRSYCYYNKLTKERRDWCYPEQRTLAANIGVSVDTIQRELKKPVTTQFIRREARYRYDARLARPVRTADTYFISMDDPLTPGDLQQVAETAKKRLATMPDSGKPQNAAYPDKPVDNSADKPQSAAQVAAANGGSGIITLKKDSITLSEDIHMQTSSKKEAIVHDILAVCQDQHSRKYYERVADAVPEARIWAALSEIKDATCTGRLKRSKGAYFTYLMKSYTRSNENTATF